MNKIIKPGKILLYGGYILLEGKKGLSLGVYGKNNEGAKFEFKYGDEKIISYHNGSYIGEFCDIEQGNSLLEIAYREAKNYIVNSNIEYKPVEIYLETSHIFGESFDEKTGLGSSSAVVTGIVESILKANNVENKELVFELSCTAYLKYSGKIGSGYDIATATWGRTIIYRMPNYIQPFDVPDGIDVIYLNIKNKCTSTISNVKAYKIWKEKDPKTNRRLVDEIAYYDDLAINALKNREFESVLKYTNKSRELYKKMQNEISKYVDSFDPIEPNIITPFIDEVCKLKNVICGKCPGAGGYDGIVFLVKETFRDTDKILDIADNLGLKANIIELKLV